MEDYEIEYEVEIDQATSELLAAIAKADDDALSLATISHIDPDKFRKFLSQSGNDDNQDAKELLKAAELLRSRERNTMAAATTQGLIREEIPVDGQIAERSARQVFSQAESIRPMDQLIQTSIRVGRFRASRQWSRFVPIFAVLVMAITGVVVILSFRLKQAAFTAALSNLEGQVQQAPGLFDAPSSLLQAEFLGRSGAPQSAREVVSTLYERRKDLSETALEQAALLAFALEDYPRASAFVDTGLNKSSNDKRLLAARGLIEYEQSFYPQALASFQRAAPPTSNSNANFAAAIIGNEGLARWDLGQTKDAELSLSKSVALLDGEEQQIYLLLTQADLYADYGQAAKALEASNNASSLLNARSFDHRTHVYKAHILRLQAKLAFFRGDTEEAKRKIDEAIRIHQEESSVWELAQDKGVQAEIQAQTGMHKEALRTLEEAAQSYKGIEYVKGQSESLLQAVEVLARGFIDLNQYEEAKGLISKANDGFIRINYKKGLGKCESLRGVLILQLASHNYVERLNANMTSQEKQAASEEFLNQARTAVEHLKTAISTFQAIGYKPGIAYAQDKLAINLVLLDEEPSKEIFSLAVQNSTEAAQTYEEIDNKRGQAVAYGNLGIIYRKSKQYEPALTNLERSLQICRDIDFKLGIGRQLFNLGRLYYERAFSEKNEQYLRKARTFFHEARRTFREIQAADELKLSDLYLENLSQILR